MRYFNSLKRYFPVIAFFAGFLWDAFTLGRKVGPAQFVQLGITLLGAGIFIYWLARRDHMAQPEPRVGEDWRGRWQSLLWQAPYLLVQFFFGGIFSALFILYFKSAGHLGTWFTAIFLGCLLVGNEFMGQRYGRRFTLTWGLFGLNAILLMNFVLPYAVGSLNPLWFYVSTIVGALLAHALHWFSPGRPGRIMPAWGVAVALILAWNLDMIAPVPLVNRDVAVGQEFGRKGQNYTLRAEQAPFWQFWRSVARTQHVPEGGRLYGVSAVFAPFGVSAPLEHRWEYDDPSSGWRLVARSRFQATGGREKGFRGYSYVTNPTPGAWRFTVATQDGRTIAVYPVQVERGEVVPDNLVMKEF